MKRTIGWFLLVVPIWGHSAAEAAALTVESVYTSLEPSTCNPESGDREGGDSAQSCPGIHGYSLLLLDSDDRMSITVVTPDKREHPLDFWKTVTPAFSSMGYRAEWRVGKQADSSEPLALIVTLNVVDDFESNDDTETAKATSYKVVVRLAQGAICVVDKLEAGPGVDDRARQEADSSAGVPCLER